MAFYPDLINSPAAQSTNYQFPNILKSPYSLLNILIIMQYNTDIYSPKDPNSRKYSYLRYQDSLSLYQLLTFYLQLIQPRNYPLTPFTPVQPSYPVKVVTCVDDYHCLVNYSEARSTPPIIAEVYVKTYNC